MTRYRARAVLLLFGVLSLTGCIGPYGRNGALYSWQSIGPVSPAQFIEEDRLERVRVSTEDVTELEVLAPSVDGDAPVAPGNFSIPFADIRLLEVRRFSAVL